MGVNIDVLIDLLIKFKWRSPISNSDIREVKMITIIVEMKGV